MAEKVNAERLTKILQGYLTRPDGDPEKANALTAFLDAVKKADPHKVSLTYAGAEYGLVDAIKSHRREMGQVRAERERWKRVAENTKVRGDAVDTLVMAVLYTLKAGEIDEVTITEQRLIWLTAPVPRMTIRRALDRLEQKGWIERTCSNHAGPWENYVTLPKGFNQ